MLKIETENLWKHYCEWKFQETSVISGVLKIIQEIIKVYSLHA